MTQELTTMQKVRETIDGAVNSFRRHDYMHYWMAVTEAAEQIAVVIDGLQGKLESAQSEIEELKDQRDNEREKVDHLRKALQDNRETYLKALSSTASDLKAARAHLISVGRVVLEIPWGLGIVFDPTNLTGSLRARIEAGIAEMDKLRDKADAWDKREAWKAAENNPSIAESGLFPLIFAYDEAARKARGEK